MILKQNISLKQGWQLEDPGGGLLSIASMPRQVHEILHENGLISDDFLIGLGEDSKWVAERDWTYRCRFSCDNADAEAYLWFGCLDTIAEIYLNGEQIASSRSIYLPLRIRVTGKLKSGENLLEIRFESPYRYMDEHPLPPNWQGKFQPARLLRKSGCDFNDYLGARPYLTLIGVAGEIQLQLIDKAEITSFDPAAELSDKLTDGSITVKLSASCCDYLTAKITVCGPDGKNSAESTMELSSGAGECRIEIPNPHLWWPIGYGEHPLYTVEAQLLCGGEVIDSCVKEVGFRTLTANHDFDVRINGRKVRLWGANLPPFDGKTHCWNPERAAALLNFVELGNMNTLRIWGEGEQLNDEFYRMCDQRGILLWHEFYHGYGMQPNTEEHFELCLKEAEYHIKRLRHHPSIFMWCGGNEGLMGGEFDQPGAEPIGSEIYAMYEELAQRLDPNRYFHLNSPYCGAYTNDPTTGDCHGYEMWWYVPGMEYPVAFTEHMRVSGAQVKSLRRFIPEDELWPKDFVNISLYSDKNAKMMPEGWLKRTGGMLERKCGPIHLFRDADSPEELAYKYSAAHALSFKQGIARSRMGRPSGSDIPRISNCHLIWKLSDTWPLIYSAIIDYYLEPYMPFYAAKRGYEPVAVCFDIRDHITAWLVNDSPNDVEGTLEYGIYSMTDGKFTAKAEAKVKMAAGESGEAVCFDSFGQFRTDNVICAHFVDRENDIDYRVHDLVDIERRLIFPDAKLSMTVKGDVLSITSDDFAHCVELSGNDGGDEFGFYFEDNFFDLLPGVEKRVRILGRHTKGRIKGKAHYSTDACELDWQL